MGEARAAACQARTCTTTQTFSSTGRVVGRRR